MSRRLSSPGQRTSSFRQDDRFIWKSFFPEGLVQWPRTLPMLLTLQRPREGENVVPKTRGWILKQVSLNSKMRLHLPFIIECKQKFDFSVVWSCEIPSRLRSIQALKVR